MTKSDKLTTIGPRLKVALLRYGVNDVPAKVDTGADSSAIWASNVTEADGCVSFVLFDKISPHYNGETITTKDYSVGSIRNSFGQVENRYKVKLQVKIAGRTINARFTLADRSANRFPVLIGRRTLQGKFLVDVAQAQKEATFDVLTLASKTNKSTQEFLDAAAKLTTHKTEITLRNLKTLSFWIKTGDVTIRETDGNRDIGDFDFVYFKSHRRYYEFAIAAAEYLNYHRVRFVDQELSSYVAYDKLAELTNMALHGIAVPATYCSSAAVLRQQAPVIVAKLGTPFVCKEINADRGQKNYLLQTADELMKTLAAADPNDQFILQQFIQNDGYLRLLVFGSSVSVAISRTSVAHKNPQKQHLNNPVGSPNASLLQPQAVPDDARDLALSATKVMRRQVAGVDVIQDKRTGEWMVLEINTAPQLATGSFLDEKRAAFATFIDLELNR